MIIGGLGGYLTVFIFGTIYYGDAYDGANVLILTNGFYADDWSCFGAFVAAPVGGLLFCAASTILRHAILALTHRVFGKGQQSSVQSLDSSEAPNTAAYVETPTSFDPEADHKI